LSSARTCSEMPRVPPQRFRNLPVIALALPAKSNLQQARVIGNRWYMTSRYF
jgi:hypothetical protein